MSAGYAERLSEYPNKGKCGLPESFDTTRTLTSKLDLLAKLMCQSSYTVVLTGAGCSTTAGIPDFRGPNGVWTREMKERKKKKNSKKRTRDDLSSMNKSQFKSEISSDQSKQKVPSFESAIPTYTHRALTHLILRPAPQNKVVSNSSDNDSSQQRTYVNHIITQNIDGLHRKSCLPRKHLSILHGDIFTEICDKCHTEHIRPYEISSIGLSYTGRNCTLGGIPQGSCQGKLMDTLLDWEDDLPEEDWRRAQEECEKADLIICMGTSLRIEPAGGLCMFAKDDGTNKKQRKKLGYVIVNLQVTPYDDDAALIVRGKVDDVMEGLMHRLGYAHDWDDIHDYGKTGDRTTPI